MATKISIVFCLFFLSLSMTTSSIGQSSSKQPSFLVFDLGDRKNKIVYASENDGLPEKFTAKGTIVQSSVSGTYCGTVATGGTLKIKLEGKVAGYPNENLFVVVLCLAGEENEKLNGKSIELEVEKMTKFPYSFGVLLSNSIDSNNQPFYKSTVEGVGGLLKKLTRKK